MDELEGSPRFGGKVGENSIVVGPDGAEIGGKSGEQRVDNSVHIAVDRSHIGSSINYSVDSIDSLIQ